MDWTVPIGDSVLETLKWVLALMAAFALLVRLMPCNRGMYWWKDRAAAATDLLYWFVVPLLCAWAIPSCCRGAGVVFWRQGPRL